jgi:hypothetical protein
VGAACYFRNSAELAELLSRVSRAEWESQRAAMKEIAVRRYRRSIIADKYAEILNA